MLDYTYIRHDRQTGQDLAWWVEGLPQYVQMVQLGETLSWQRANYDATLLDVFTNRGNQDRYHDGMRVFAFLRGHDRWTLSRLVDVVKSGIYLAPERPQYWHDLLGHAAWRHQRPWEYWSSVKEDEHEASVPPLVEGRVGGEPDSSPSDASTAGWPKGALGAGPPPGGRKR